jgi:hypothetical protein
VYCLTVHELKGARTNLLYKAGVHRHVMIPDYSYITC